MRTAGLEKVWTAIPVPAAAAAVFLIKLLLDNVRELITETFLKHDSLSVQITEQVTKSGIYDHSDYSFSWPQLLCSPEGSPHIGP